MNYSQLLNAITNTAANLEPSFIANIPMFVRQAEQRVFNMVHLLSLRRNVTSAVTAGYPYIKAPSDFLAVYAFAVVDPQGEYHYLINKDVNYIREAYPNPQSRNMPRHYGLFSADTFIIGPTPDLAYPVELHQFYYPESIVDAGTSWLGDNFDAALLYGAMVYASIYMKGDKDMTDGYNTQFVEVMSRLKRLGDGLDRQDTYRSGQVKLPVT